ncbi:hypothetical protein KAU43_05860 [candidate division WOR-3 bacterium]|nr:hypothetical protein [candidate division WOR-3 bacterium]
MMEYIIYLLATFGLIIGCWIAFNVITEKIRKYRYAQSDFKSAEFKGDKFKLSLDLSDEWSDDCGKEIVIIVYSKYGGYLDTIRIPEYKWRK